MKTILVADDELPLLHVLASVLEYEGYRVVTATDGEEVMSCVAESRPDIILCDVMMPRMDGREVCRALRADPALRHTPLVLMSAAYATIDKDDCDDAIFVPKPFDLDTIVELVERLTG